MPEQQQPDQQLVDRYISAYYPKKTRDLGGGKTYEEPEITPFLTEEAKKISEEIAAVISASENPEELAVAFARRIQATLGKMYPPNKCSPYIHPVYGVEFLCDMRGRGATPPYPFTEK